MKFEKRFTDPESRFGPYVFLNLENTELNNCNYDYEPYLCFYISTYKLITIESSDLNVAFGTTHSFLKSCTEDEKVAYAELLLAIHYRIKSDIDSMQELDGKKIMELESLFAGWINEFVEKLNLMTRLEEFTSRHIFIPSFEGAGERAKDSIDMTYFRPDYIRLTAIVLLCKMLMPIFGVFMESLKRKSDTSMKENHCAALLRDVLAGSARQGYDKLRHFLKQIAKNYLSNISLRQEFAGITEASADNIIAANMLTRRFITVDMYKSDGNLIKYVTSCARNIAEKQCGNAAAKNAVVTNTPISDKAFEEDGNMSTLEAESRSSNKSGDHLAIIRMCVDQHCKRMLTEHDMDRDVWQACVDYYSVNHVSMTPFNSYMLGTIFGPTLGGAATIELVDIHMLTRLVPLFQLYCVQQGYYDLIDAASLQPTGQAKSVVAPTDSQLAITFASSLEYRSCNQKFTFCVNDLRWDTGLRKVITSVTSEQYLINTAPALVEHANLEFRNGDVYYPPVNLSQKMCSMILSNVV